MQITTEGFLSKSSFELSRKICSEHDGVFRSLESVLEEIKRFASEQEITEQKTDEGRQRVIALVLLARIIEISEASLLVMKHGMSNETSSLFRVFLDAYFVFANVCNSANFIADYFKSDEEARLKLLNSAARRNSDIFAMVNEYGAQAKAELEQKVREENIQAFNSFNYAEKVGCGEIYDSMYRICSASIHTTPRSLGKYVEEDADGNIIAINVHPWSEIIPERAYDFAYFLIKVLSGTKEVFGCLNQEEIEAMVDKLNRNSSKSIE